MLKKLTKFLLVFVMTLQILVPPLVVNAAEVEGVEEYGEGLIEPEAMSATFTGERRIDAIFPDGDLARIIANELNLTPATAITQAQLDTITELEIEGREPTVIGTGVWVQSLAGMQYLRNLEELNVWWSGVSDLRPLSNLSSLRILRISRSEIVDVSPLRGLTGLTRLVLPQNRISDVSPLSTLVNLNALILDSNQITDLRPIANLPILSANPTLEALSINEQWFHLPQTRVGERVRIEIFLPNGDQLDLRWLQGRGVYNPPYLIWNQTGTHSFGWEGGEIRNEEGERISLFSGDITQTVLPANVQTHTVTVQGGTGGGSAAVGSTVSLTANTPPAGQRFVRWEEVNRPSGATALSFSPNATTANASFVMPARNVTVRAVFEPLDNNIFHNHRVIAVMNRTVPLRSGPGANTTSQGNINQGTRLLVIGESADGTWIQIQAGSRTGWVNRTRVNNFGVDAVANATVALRNGPGTNFGQNGNVSRGANVTAIARSGDWTQIRVGNRIGWTRTDRLNETASVSVMNHSVPLRSGPGTSHAPLRTVTRGTRVTVLGVSNTGNWTRIRIGNDIGWVSTNRLNHLRVSAVSNAAVVLRGGPGTNFSQVGNVARGANLHFIGQSGDWVRVRVGNNTGWIRENRMTAVSSTRRTTASVPLRSGPGTNHSQVRNVANNAQVTALGTSRSGEWTHIRVGNDVGWVRTNRLR